MENLKLITAQNIQIEYKLGGFGNRILAKLVDNIIRFAYLILIFILLVQFIGKDGDSTFKNPSTIILLFLSLFPYFFYSLFFEIFMNGQTPGKKSFNMKVASIDGKPTTIWQYLLRWIFLIIDNLGFGLLTMAFTKKIQRVGDLVAGTTVISTEENLQTNIFSGIQFPENYKPKFPEAYQLSDHDISVLKDLVNQAHTQNSVPDRLISKAATKIKEILQVEFIGPELGFLQDVIMDYTYHFRNLS